MLLVTTYTTSAIGSGTPSQPQRFNLSHATLEQPTACMPRDQLPTHNNREQCISVSYMQSATAPYSRAPSTTSRISTPGPIVHHITHIEDDRGGDYHHMTTVPPSACDDTNYSSYIAEQV